MLLVGGFWMCPGNPSAILRVYVGMLVRTQEISMFCQCFGEMFTVLSMFR